MTPLWQARALRGGGTRHAFGPSTEPTLTPQTLKRRTAWPLVVAAIIACISAGSVTCANAANLKVTLTGVRNGNGTVNICVFTSEKGFPDCSNSPSLIALRKPAQPGTLQFNFDIDPGLYAVSVLHDENNNGRLDTNFLGIPREGGGVSNNPPPRYGPPRFADAVFRLPPEGGEIVVKLVYP